jgi:hypothetical protein
VGGWRGDSAGVGRGGGAERGVADGRWLGIGGGRGPGPMAADKVRGKTWRAPPAGIEPATPASRASALPLGHRSLWGMDGGALSPPAPGRHFPGCWRGMRADSGSGGVEGADATRKAVVRMNLQYRS